MKMSQLFSHTLRDAPSEADIASHQLLLRAGYIRQVAAGIFALLPLGQRVRMKIEQILRDEMDAIGGQELSMPVVNPADLWKETGRWFSVGAELGRFKDRTGRDMALAMTHEEVTSDLVRREVRSYRQLPQLIYHLQTKWRDDPRPRGGLVRVREFIMKDSYSLDADFAGLDRQYRDHYQAYFNIFHRCGLSVIAVKADVGMMGGSLAHEYMYLNPIGEDTILICGACGYQANRQIARFRKPEAALEEARPVEKVATPETKTIEALAELLGVPKSKTAKAVFLMATPKNGAPEAGTETGQQAKEQFVFAIVRGDMEVNETKLANAVQAKELRPALESEIAAIGAVPGYASPVGLKNVLVVVDEAIPASPNLVAGANESGYHLLNVNYGRDYQAGIVADIAAAEEGCLCPECGQALRAERGVEVGNIFKLGTWFSEAMGCTYLDQDGQEKPVVMGSYGIGVGRLMACVAEEHHDDHGLVWPVTIAPFDVHIVSLAGRDASGQVAETAGRLYQDLRSAGLDVLFDDRPESPGVKFNDADLIGLPLRITVSERALSQGGVEFKRRDQAEKTIVPVLEAVTQAQAVLAALREVVEAKVVPMPYGE